MKVDSRVVIRDCQISCVDDRCRQDEAQRLCEEHTGGKVGLAVGLRHLSKCVSWSGARGSRRITGR